jgi:UDP-N-acetylglucosamine--N-acetylmuramyl-(pentapeptide) pyrophosphoryl-undecaprenol N-acetylglucosamine transferase
VEIPLPVREGYSRLAWPQEEARRNYGLDPQRLTFLVFGGSQGALALNSLVCSSAAHHLAARTQQFQVIHLTGKEGLVEEIRAEYKGAGIQACVMAFESQMEQAWAAADLVISRAGASSIAEQMAFEIPAILIPYPHSKDHHQDRNADFMEQTVGGAVNMGEEPVDAEMLAQLLVDLVGNDRRRLLEMRARIKEYKVQQHSKDLCAAVCEIAGAKVR